MSTWWPSSTTTSTSSAGPFAASPSWADPVDLESPVRRRHDIDRIFIALPDRAEKERTKPIIDRALRTSSQVKVLRSAADATTGLLRNVRDLDLSDLLGREAAPVDSDEIAELPRRAPRSSSRAGAARSAARSPARCRATGRAPDAGGSGRERSCTRSPSGSSPTAETVLLDIRDRRPAHRASPPDPSGGGVPRRGQQARADPRTPPRRGGHDQRAQHVVARQRGGRARLPAVRAPLHRQGRAPLLGDGCDQAGRRARGGGGGRAT